MRGKLGLVGMKPWLGIWESFTGQMFGWVILRAVWALFQGTFPGNDALRAMHWCHHRKTVWADSQEMKAGLWTPVVCSPCPRAQPFVFSCFGKPSPHSARLLPFDSQMQQHQYRGNWLVLEVDLACYTAHPVLPVPISSAPPQPTAPKLCFWLLSGTRWRKLFLCKDSFKCHWLTFK